MRIFEFAAGGFLKGNRNTAQENNDLSGARRWLRGDTLRSERMTRKRIGRQRSAMGLVAAATLIFGLGLAGSARATTLNVNATDAIYSPSGFTSSGSTSAASIAVSAGDNLTFGVSGTIIVNNGSGDNSNNADGVGAASSSSKSTGYGSISGINAPDAGYLVGMFAPLGGPTGTAPTSLDFRSGGIGTSFASLSPLLDQVFFIGDGLTGNGTGTPQTFTAPTTATTLYLGISDACSYSGLPGCYGDNSGSFSVTVSDQNLAATPLPPTLPMFVSAFGMLGLLGWSWKRKPDATAA